MENAVVADFITPSMQWVVAKLNQFFIDYDVEAIQCLPISSSASHRWIWHYDRKREYSVKSGYKFVMLKGQETSLSSMEKRDFLVEK